MLPDTDQPTPAPPPRPVSLAWAILLALVLCAAVLVGLRVLTTHRADSSGPARPTATQASPSTAPAGPDQPPDSSGTFQRAQPPGEESKVDASWPPGVSLQQYNQLRDDMSASEVFALLGDGEEVGRTENYGLVIVVYRWKGRGSLGAHATATFYNGRLRSKSQAGLE